MDTKQRLADLAEYAETQVDIINENLANAFTRLCEEVVADWSRRYPRHRFRIWEGHGMLSTDCSPPLGRLYRTDFNQGRWEEITNATGAHLQRGAIAVIWKEANDLHEAFNKLDLPVRMNLNKVVGEPL